MTPVDVDLPWLVKTLTGPFGALIVALIAIQKITALFKMMYTQFNQRHIEQEARLDKLHEATLQHMAVNTETMRELTQYIKSCTAGQPGPPLKEPRNSKAREGLENLNEGV